MTTAGQRWDAGLLVKVAVGLWVAAILLAVFFWPTLYALF
jgi:hypothetical protein